MAENCLWSWESPNASPSSHSSHDAMRNFYIPTTPQLDDEEFLQGAAEEQLSFMETLETYSAHSPTATEPSAASPGWTIAEPIRFAPSMATATSLPSQSRQSSSLSSSGADPLSPKHKPTKRRSRASRRLPTTVLETTCGDFRETVHRLTGMDPKPTPKSPGPVRPRPIRVTPPTIARPVRHFPSNSTSSPASFEPTFWNQLQINQAPPCTDFESFKPLPYGSSSSPSSSKAEATQTTMSWWDVQESEQSRTNRDLMNTSSESKNLQDDPKFSIEDWFQQTKYSSSAYMH